MFTVYQKLITPETSPVIGPVNASSNTTPRESPTITPKEDPLTNEPNAEPFSLCNYCCSPRPKQGTTSKQDPIAKPDPSLTLMQDQFEFGHATHYKYNAATPRLICEFETGTPP